MTFRSILKNLTDPHKSVTDPPEAMRMRAMATGTLFIAITCISMCSLTFFGGMVVSAIVTKMFISLAAICFLVYGLLRTKFRKYGIWIFLVCTSAIVQVRPFLTTMPPERLIYGLNFISVISTAGVLVLGFRSAMKYMILNLVLMLSAFVIRSDIHTAVGYLTVLYLVIQCIFIALLAYIGSIEREIASQVSANNAVTQIVAGVAHGVNSPLAALKTMVIRLERKLNSGTETSLADIQGMVSKVNRTIDRTLIISKGLQNYVEPSASDSDNLSFSLGEACMDAVRLCQYAFSMERLTLNFDQDKHKNVFVKGNRDRFVHAFENLLSSSFKMLATADSGCVSIEIREAGDKVILALGDSSDSDMKLIHLMVHDPLMNLTAIQAGGDLEIRMAPRLFERCGLPLEVGTDKTCDKFIVTFQKSLPMEPKISSAS